MSENNSLVERPFEVPEDVKNIYNQKQLQVIKDHVAKNATDEELQYFIHLARRYRLDPFLHQIWFVKYPDKKGGYHKYIKTARDGYLIIAQRHPDFQGISSMVVKENDDFEFDMENYSIKHKFGKGKRGSIVGAWAIVRRKGHMPYVFFADYDEYKSEKDIWKNYPSAMIQKVAEENALKRAFEITGLVTEESMGKSESEFGYEDTNTYEKENFKKEAESMIVKKETKKKTTTKKEDPITVAHEIVDNMNLEEQKDAIDNLAYNWAITVIKKEDFENETKLVVVDLEGHMEREKAIMYKLPDNTFFWMPKSNFLGIIHENSQSLLAVIRIKEWLWKEGMKKDVLMDSLPKFTIEKDNFLIDSVLSVSPEKEQEIEIAYQDYVNDGGMDSYEDFKKEYLEG